MIVGGFGGQGTLLAGTILGRAASLEGKNVVLTTSYGAEARGGMARSEVVISDEEIDYPMVMQADALIAMSQAALKRYSDKVRPAGSVIIDEGLIKEIPQGDVRVIRVPASKIASEELKMPIATNIIMLGVLAATTDIASHNSFRRSVEANVPKDTVSMNLHALNRGWRLGESLALGRKAENP